MAFWSTEDKQGLYLPPLGGRRMEEKAEQSLILPAHLQGLSLQLLKSPASWALTAPNNSVNQIFNRSSRSQ